jgi:prepilin-type N-terminal cleavage/methylation domain-containing protein
MIASSRSSRRGAARRATTPRGGFTVTEVVVAVMILSIGVLGLAGTSAAVARQMGGSADMTRAASRAASRLERLSGMSTCPPTSGTSGSETSNGVVERWSMRGAGGMAITANVIDSVRILPKTRWYVFQSDVRCAP